MAEVAAASDPESSSGFGAVADEDCLLLGSLLEERLAFKWPGLSHSPHMITLCSSANSLLLAETGGELPLVYLLLSELVLQPLPLEQVDLVEM